ncbi:MAG: ABC transporter ATP-binding protein/permease [Bacteroidales bacterium]|nr:ABC transporter ATP-binding protein/permease [Bacteroidales bacterium]MCL2737976.1 ABC transporter ATP-binding protein/permease [Bacteroidales bacterium]
MKTFLRLLSFGKPYSRFWPSYLVICIFSVVFGIVNFALIAPLLEVLFQPQNYEITSLPEFSFTIDYFKSLFSYYLSDILHRNGVLNGLIYVCIFLIITTFLSNLTRYWSQRILVRMRTLIMQNIRRELFHKITRLHIGYFHDRRKGDILSSVSNDVTEVQNSVASSFHIVFRDPILLVGFLSMLFYMSPRLTLVALLTLPITAVVITRITRSLKRGAVDTQRLLGRIISQFEEAISGARIIKAFNAQHYVREKFEETNSDHRRLAKKIFNRQELASPLSEFLGVTVAVGVLFYGGWLQIQGNLGMGWPEFVVYIGFYWRVLEPAKAISNAYAVIQRGLVSGDRIFAILDEEPKIKKATHAIPKNTFDHTIEFRNVHFSYGQESVLKNINLEVKKGKMIALVGPSGAGKSTLADLVPRFYDVHEGAVLLDGIDIKQYQPKDLIGLMGIVTQEPILFNDTVYQNICFGAHQVSEEEVYRAAQIANAHEFIIQMEQGYQTNIGDRGVKLSGGQRQRLAIARAVLKNPPILILDEATSALDTESERLVQDALTKLMQNRTSIVIAHRLSTIRHADEIVVIKDGMIVEQGQHDRLMQKGGLYKHLCDMQNLNKNEHLL